jgi:predicted RNA-binding Zn-ribbon protein involved in translation (DUF1610 family)
MQFVYVIPYLVAGIALGCALDRAIVGSMHRMLDGLVRRSAASVFFKRAFRLCIFMTVAQEALSRAWDPAKPLVQQSWEIAGATGDMLGKLMLVVLAFVIFATIMVAALGRKPADPPVCDRCGYNLKGQVDELRCPECGEHYASRD